METAEACLDCKAPFSFFFNFIRDRWKSPIPPSNNLTLHRICTLARKQGASFVTVECALDRADVKEDITALDEHHGGGGEAEAIAISFFSGSQSPAEIQKVTPNAAIGAAVVINYKKKGAADWEHSYVYEAIALPPQMTDEDGKAKRLLNNYICRDTEFKRTIRGREFVLRGFYYCQQNNLTHVCAHACLRMAINSIDGSSPPLTSAAINTLLKVKPPIAGLQIGQIVDTIKDKTGTEPVIVDCTKLAKSQDYISVLTSFVESGCIVLLVFTTAHDTEHVVTVFGHTRNTDEWHPQAIPGYSGPESAPFYQSSSWVDHFVIHDDNLGPYYTLSTRALEVDPTIKAHWIIAIHPHRAEISPHYAESLTAIILRDSAPNLAPLGTGDWADYVFKNRPKPVTRAILLSRENYIAHLTASVAHDESRLTAAQIANFASLPDWFWMVEYSVPALFTGNRSKLGEVLIATKAGQAIDVVLGLRAPSVLVYRDAANEFKDAKTSMLSHSPIFVVKAADSEW